MAEIIERSTMDNGRTVVIVAGEDLTRPQVVLERGVDLDPVHLAALDIAANHRANRMTRPVRSARQRH